MNRPVVKIIESGTGVSLQDAGRPGWRRFGVPPGGYMDPHAARLANRLVGNLHDAPVLEVSSQGCCVEFLVDTEFAICGAQHVARFQAWRTHVATSGQRVHFSSDGCGVWSYLAVAGGFKGTRWLGSVSANPRAGFGRGLRRGDVVMGAGSGPITSRPSWLGVRTVVDEECRDYDHPPDLPVWDAPQGHLFDRAARDLFFSSPWTITARHDRTGFRLDGPALSVPERELVSEPVLPGTIQIPPNGKPVVIMPDGPTVGGYHKIAFIDPEWLSWLAQCRCGQDVRFVRADEHEVAADRR